MIFGHEILIIIIFCVKKEKQIRLFLIVYALLGQKILCHMSIKNSYIVIWACMFQGH